MLVAEDDPSVRMTIELALMDEGFDIRFAEDGKQALHMARSVIPDVLLLDQHMPKMSGREVLTELRREGPTSNIAVVVISGSDGPASEWPDARIVPKPFSPDYLIKTIRSALRDQAQT